MLEIVIDTREQKPYVFINVPIIGKKLDAGDYSITGYENRITVERKTLVDLYGTVGKGRNRFERELEKLERYDYAAIIIEASLDTVARLPPPRAKLLPKVVIRSLIAWAQRYGVHVIFADNRALAQRICFLILERFYRDIEEGKRA